MMFYTIYKINKKKFKMTDKEKINLIKELIANQQDIDEDIQKVINEHFWEMI